MKCWWDFFIKTLSCPSFQTTGSCLLQVVLLHFLCNLSTNMYRIWIVSGIQMWQLYLSFVGTWHQLCLYNWHSCWRVFCITSRPVWVMREQSLSSVHFHFAYFILLQSHYEKQNKARQNEARQCLCTLTWILQGWVPAHFQRLFGRWWWSVMYSWSPGAAQLPSVAAQLLFNMGCSRSVPPVSVLFVAMR